MAILQSSDVEKFIMETYSKNPFVETCDIKMESVTPGQAILSLDVDDKHTNIYGAAHGGVLATLMDTAMGVVGASVGVRIVTLNLNINYINSIYFFDKATAVATITHKGKTTLIVDAVVKNAKGELIAKGTGTLFVMGSFDEIPTDWGN